MSAVLQHQREPDVVEVYLTKKQLQMIRDDSLVLWIGAGTKTGKALHVDSLVYTPTGPKRMGDVKQGDVVLTPDGTAKVAGVFPQGPRQLFSVEFADGTVVEADADHLWEVTNKAGDDGRETTRTLTTERLSRYSEKRLRRTWVPKIRPVEFKAQAVPIDPYVIGLLIGDGGLKTSVVFSSADPELVAALRARLPPRHELVRVGGVCDWRVTARGKLNKTGRHIARALSDLGLRVGSHEKSIPSVYLYNSVEVREAVLRGILDTDGFIGKHGEPCIDQTSAALASDITALVQSLGGSVLTRTRFDAGYRLADGTKRVCRPVYRQVIRLSDTSRCFGLARKATRCWQKVKPGNRVFRSILPSRIAEAQCILIDDPRGLFLTDGFIPTHNTVGLANWIAEGILMGEPTAWCGPWSDKTRKAFNLIVEILAFAIRGGHVKVNESTMKITSTSGGVFYPFTGDNPEAIYGDAYKRFVIDEASRQSEETLTAALTTVSAVEGRVKIAFNLDHGSKNWAIKGLLKVKGWSDEKRAAMRENYMLFPTLDEGFVSKKFIELMRSKMPKAMFEALYLAIIPESDVALFQNLPQIFSGPGTVAPISGHSYVMGVDLARKANWTVATVMDATDKRSVDAERFNTISWTVQYERIAALYAKWGCSKAWIDATGIGDPAVEEIAKRGVVVEPFVFTKRSKKELIEELVVACDGPKFFASGDERFKTHLSEMDSYEYQMDEKGEVTYGAPEHRDDDCVISQALAWHAILQGNFGRPEFIRGDTSRACKLDFRAF